MNSIISILKNKYFYFLNIVIDLLKSRIEIIENYYKNNIRKYFKYTSYLFRHKWFVMCECFRIGLVWRGLKHDWDKFTVSSFLAYARFFGKAPVRDETGYYKPTNTGDVDFERAWFRHTRIHDHHWQHWVLSTEDGEEVFKMIENAINEMICDWIGAGKAQGALDTLAWWNKNKSKMKFHKDTYNLIEKKLSEIEAWKISRSQKLDVE